MNPRGITAILLVGGEGTRLRPLTLARPKVLVPLLNVPFISYQFHFLKRAGIRRVVLAANTRFRKWEKAIRKVLPKGMDLTFAFEKQPLGTGGASRFAVESLKKAPAPTSAYLVFNGDVLFGFNLKDYVSHHHKMNADCSLALVRLEDPSRCGVVKTNLGGRVQAFIEKPRHWRGPAYVNAGAYLIRPNLIKLIPSGRFVSVERETFPNYLSLGFRLFGYRISGYWNDIGTTASYLRAHQDILKNRSLWATIFPKQKGVLRRGNIVFDRTAHISSGTTLSGFVAIGPRVKIEKGTTIQNAVIHEGSHVQAGCSIRGAILGKKSVVKSNAQVREGSVLGEKTIVSPHSKI